MRSVYDFIVKPIEGRYNNTKKIGGVNFITNTKIEDYKSVSKEAEVISTPLALKTNIKVGDRVVVHHNVFRRFYDIRGKEKNSRSHIKENMYVCSPEQVYLYGDNKSHLDYCFVQPVVNNDSWSTQKEKPLIGILKFGNKLLEDNNVLPNMVVGFTPESEFEFVIDGELLYCMKSENIVLAYGNKGNEAEYNPSWTNSR
jgi:hypothetical protein|tara:strand:- start:5995 stop:6591 length:597 start_codon:yes stop_codon:yes gene_type:complete